jgi:diaminopimelate decarboxylase
MTFFECRNGRLQAEDVDIGVLAEAVGTPFYCYSTRVLEENYRRVARAFPAGTLIAYSAKANGNLAVLKTLARLGAGADVVSGGELKKALAAGIPANRIVFSGVGKTRAEMKLGLHARIHQFNVESEPELDALSEIASAMGAIAPVAIRVNPDVDPRTHAKISTGTAETKFGIPWKRAPQAYARAASLPGVKVIGVDVHIGSQITEIEPFEQAFARIAKLIAILRSDGHEIARADLGGGLGIDYREDSAPDLTRYAEAVNCIVGDLGVSLILEPGRMIAASAGILVSQVLYIKQGESKLFAVLDAGMNDLLRPALYGAHHTIVCVAPRTEAAEETYDVVGPVCETSDLFGRYQLPRLQAGDLLAIKMAGAYGAAMASAYNARPAAAEVMVNGGRWSVVRPKMSDDEFIGLDRIPDWLE